MSKRRDRGQEGLHKIAKERVSFINETGMEEK